MPLQSELLKPALLIVFLSLSAFLLKAQDTTGYKRISIVTKTYPEKPITPLDSVFFNSPYPDMLFIDLREGFNDSVCIYINNECIKNEFLKTNHSIDHAASFGISVSQDCKKVMTILFKNAKKFIQEELISGFKHLEIRGFNEWHFIYSNRFYLSQ